MAYYSKTIGSPIGTLTLVASDRGLAAVLWENEDPQRIKLGPISKKNKNAENKNMKNKKHPILVKTESQLKEYFAGRRKAFSIRLDVQGTIFQNKVWQALVTIPFGETRSYGEIARQIRNAKSVRAVGAANSRNPIGIIVPCHRVIGASGRLTGFAGGLDVKERLLLLEGNRSFKK